MKKTDIEKIRIDILSTQDSALSMIISRDGTLGRQGNGALPIELTRITGSSDISVFKKLLDRLDENVFPHAGVYDHPHKPGIPLTYSVAFLDKNQNTSLFEFRFSSETRDVGELLPFFDGFISQAIELTNEWYAAGKLKISCESV